MICLSSKNKQKFYLNTSLCQGKVIHISMSPISTNQIVPSTPRIQYKYLCVMSMKVMIKYLANFTVINSHYMC